MEFILPSNNREDRIVLADLYPFVREVDYGGDALLRAEVLVQEQCTIPGSMALEEPSIRSLIQRNLPLLKCGALVLDMRNTVRSFNQLKEDKFGREADDDIHRMADLLDEHCLKVIHFDPTENAKFYGNNLKSFVNSCHAKANLTAEKKALDKILNDLERLQGELTYNVAERFRTGSKTLDAKILSAVKFFYCVTGADFVNGTVQVPQYLWEAVSDPAEIAYIGDQYITGSTDLSVAHHAVLDHFAFSVDALERLTPEDIVELREEGATRVMVDDLKKIVLETQLEFSNAGAHISHNLDEIKNYRAKITDREKEQSLKQAKRKSTSIIGEMGIDEIAALAASNLEGFIPGFSPMRKGLLYLGRIISREGKTFRRADLTMSPIHTYFSRLQERVHIRR